MNSKTLTLPPKRRSLGEAIVSREVLFHHSCSTRLKEEMRGPVCIFGSNAYFHACARAFAFKMAASCMPLCCHPLAARVLACLRHIQNLRRFCLQTPCPACCFVAALSLRLFRSGLDYLSQTFSIRNFVSDVFFPDVFSPVSPPPTFS